MIQVSWTKAPAEDCQAEPQGATVHNISSSLTVQRMAASQEAPRLLPPPFGDPRGRSESLMSGASLSAPPRRRRERREGVVNGGADNLRRRFDGEAASPRRQHGERQGDQCHDDACRDEALRKGGR